jgi:putative colanic acid biosynthesis glycosyltransferase
MKVLQINSSVNTGSTGRIAEEIGRTLQAGGHESWIAYGRPERPSGSNTIRIGTGRGQLLHALQTRIFDTHGFASKNDTQKFVGHARAIKPDLVHLHNMHGYYLHIGVLFQWLREARLPVVWTLHDCWSFTGHCTYFDSVQCEKWQKACHHCPKTRFYPSSYVLDASASNFERKKALFNSVERMCIVTPSAWLANHVRHSFLSRYPLRVIHNGVDLDLFQPAATSDFRRQQGLEDRKIILGVASIWDKRKGLDDFKSLGQLLPDGYQIVLVGLSEQQCKELPDNITGIKRTESVAQLAGLYATADVFINPTWQDNFPTTNIEALACGTRVITYDAGGSPEAVDADTGAVLRKGDVQGLCEMAVKLAAAKSTGTETCRNRALQLFGSRQRYQDYLGLYSQMLPRKKYPCPEKYSLPTSQPDIFS